MNRFDLVDRIAARNNISKAEADRVVVSVFEEIMSAVTMGDSVTLIGFGSFRAVESAPPPGRWEGSRRRNHIAPVDFSALLEDRLARLRMHYDSIYNRIKFYLVSAVAKKYFHIFFVKKVLVIILILLYNGICKQFNTTHQERWREWPCEVAATIAA